MDDKHIMIKTNIPLLSIFLPFLLVIKLRTINITAPNINTAEYALIVLFVNIIICCMNKIGKT